MARFIKGDKSSRPEPDSSPTETFDFAAIARDLGAENGPSSFDSLLSKPVEATAPSKADSPQVELTPVAPPETRKTEAVQEDINFDELFSASPTAPSAPPAPVSVSPEPVVGVVPVQPEPPVPVVAPEPVPMPETVASATPSATIATPDESPFAVKTKKPPILPIAGGLLVMLLAGSAYLLNRPEAEPPLPTAPIAPPLPPSPDQSIPPIPSAAPPVERAKPETTSKAPIQRAAPTQPLTADLYQQLKTLWNKGSEAKHRQDYEGARRYWQQGLKLRPSHPGFQDSLDKMSRELKNGRF